MTRDFGPYYHPLHNLRLMTTATHLRPGDPLLISFLDASSEEAASQALAQLLATTEPVIRDAVHRELARSMTGAAHLDDVASDVRLRVVRKLWALRRHEGEPIDNLLAYVARAAEYGCYAFLRAQYPERSRFRNRLRYAIGHQASTALRCDEHGIWRCHSARPVRSAPKAGATEHFINSPRSWLAEAGIDASLPLPALTDRLLAQLDRPIELDRLVDALALVLGVTDVPPARREDEDPGLSIPDPSPGAADVLEHRDTLLRTWTEIVALPPRQRAALLLNLRDPDGGAILHLLPSTGMISSPSIAAALEIDASALAALWDKLPLDDLSIAAQLGLTRQQVINLRKSARARLARRLRGGNP